MLDFPFVYDLLWVLSITRQKFYYVFYAISTMLQLLKDPIQFVYLFLFIDLDHYLHVEMTKNLWNQPAYQKSFFSSEIETLLHAYYALLIFNCRFYLKMNCTRKFLNASYQFNLVLMYLSSLEFQNKYLH